MSKMKGVVAWREIAKPHNDIIEGRFDPSVFAVNIYAVYRNRAPADYQEPERFFAKTFMTKGLKELIAGVLRRLDGQPNSEPITDIVTSFGGGKTHALLVLYHLTHNGRVAKEWMGVSELLHEASLTRIPPAKVAVLSGEDIDAIQGVKGNEREPDRHTMWGELAWQLGGNQGYALIKGNDEKRVAPSAEILTKVLELNKVNLILIDEALSYVSRARAVAVRETSLGAQALNFFEALTVAVAQVPRASLVVTLPASHLEMTRDDEQDFKRLKHRFQRVERTRRLAEGDEIYEIVRRRLFQDLGDPEQQAKIANAYFDYYREHKDSFPETVTTPIYLKKLKRAYPFHPELLDTLNEDWSSIPQFQRTRGMLRMLALLIGELYKTDQSPLIQISSVQLSIRDFRAEILEQLDARQFDAVIESDISGTGAKAARIDEHGNLTYQREHIAEGVATAIFMYSFGGAGKEAAATIPRIRLAVLRPELEPAFIADAIQSLRKPISGLFYLHVEGDLYRFRVTPNLNMILAEREAAVNDEDIEKLVRTCVQEQVGNRFRIVMFPETSRDVSDQPQLTLAVLDPNDTMDREARAITERKIVTMIKGDASYRTNRNCLIFVVADECNEMKQSARTMIALKDVERLYASTDRLSQTQKTQLEGMLKSSEKALIQAVWDAYRFVFTSAAEERLDITAADMGRQIQTGVQKIADRIWDFLEGKERLAIRIGANRIMSNDWHLWKKEDACLSTKTLKEAFLNYPYLPLIPSIDILRDSIVQGVQNGCFAYVRGDGKTFSLIVINSIIEKETVGFGSDEFLMRPEEALIHKTRVEPPEESGVTLDMRNKPLPERFSEAPPLNGVEQYATVEVSAELDDAQLAAFREVVIQPLINAGVALKIKLDMSCNATRGLSKDLIDSIKEGLIQHGLFAKVEPRKNNEEKYDS